MKLLSLGIACLAAWPAFANETPRTRFPFWQMVSEVVQQIETRKPRPVSIGRSLDSPGQEYPFEAFRHLRAIDLIRAAHEGVQAARLQAAQGKSEAEIDAMVLRNLTIALEYFPLLATEEKDVEELLRVMADRESDPVFRRFVLDHTVAQNTAPSLLSLFLPDFIDGNDTSYAEKMTRIASHPGEPASLQVEAIRVYYKRLLTHYVRIFEADPNVARMKAAGELVVHASAAGDAGLELADETMAQLKRQGRRMEQFAEAIAGHIVEGSVRNERVKNATRQVLVDIRDTIVGVNTDILDIYLSGQIPEKESAFPAFPQMPADPILPDFSIPVEGMPLTPPMPQF